MHDTCKPVFVAIVMILANIALIWLLAPRLGHGGLALSLSITYTIRMVVLLAILSGRTGGVARDLAMSFRRMVAPAAILTGVSLAIMQPLADATDPANGLSASDYVLFSMALAVAGGVYLLASWLLRLPEFYRLRRP